MPKVPVNCMMMLDNVPANSLWNPTYARPTTKPNKIPPGAANASPIAPPADRV